LSAAICWAESIGHKLSAQAQVDNGFDAWPLKTCCSPLRRGLALSIKRGITFFEFREKVVGLEFPMR
jgi:hypothetical protein